MTCPKCGTELPEQIWDGYMYMGHYRDIEHTPDRCIAALERSVEFWRNDSAAGWGKCEERRQQAEAAEARAAELEAQLKVAREALELIDHVYGGSKTARDALAALAKEGT